MKLGDSLGRNRKRRKGKGSQPPADDAPPVEGAGLDATPGATSPPPGGASAPHGGASPPPGTAQPPTGSDRTAGAPAPPPTKLTARLTPATLLLATLALAVVGTSFGYGVATRVFFPAPPSQGDLYEVPDLKGVGLASAAERLAGAGLTLGTVDSLQHPTAGAGVVLGQSPLPTQVAPPETPVRVTVSTGPQMRAIPDVRRIEGARARTVLESSGFIVSVDSTRADAPRGQVVSMLPEPDQEVAIPSRVRITVSTGPPILTMPLLLGVSEEEAVQMLEEIGLVVSEVEEVFRFGRDQGVVVEQEPAPESEIEQGGSVRLKVGRRGVGGER